MPDRNDRVTGQDPKEDTRPPHLRTEDPADQGQTGKEGDKDMPPNVHKDRGRDRDDDDSDVVRSGR